MKYDIQVMVNGKRKTIRGCDLWNVIRYAENALDRPGYTLLGVVCQEEQPE